MADESLRALLRQTEHAHDAALWLRAASAAARAREWDEAGRALLFARALGAETGPIDDALAPTSLEHERRAAGSLVVKDHLSWLAWAPSAEHVYVVDAGRRVLRLGVEPGANAVVFESTAGDMVAAVPDLSERVLVIFWHLVEHNRIARFDLATRTIGESHTTFPFEHDDIVSFGEHVVVSEHESPAAFRFPASGGPIQPEGIVRRDSVITWSGELVTPPLALAGAPRTLRLVFAHDFGGASFPTRASVERFAALATPAVVGMTAAEIKDRVLCVAASPAGRHVAIVPTSEPLVRLVDLVSGEERRVPFDEEPLEARWSPSGRRLAVLTATRVHFLTFSG